jgi:CheY-like chemotaxis protein
VREHGRVEHERGRFRRKDGGSLEVMVSMVGAFDRAGTLIEVRGFVVDITRSAEAEEHGESIGRLAGAIAHDFNNLLMAILGYTELLLESRRPDDPDRSDLQQIQKAGQRAAALTQRLLAYSRKQVPVPKEVDLNDAIRSLRGLRPPAGGRETILLVEDEDSVRRIVAAILRRDGYQVLEAATARDACAFFDRHGAEIDLLLSDVVMPDMNGPMLAQRLVGQRPELRILFISGHVNGESPIDSGNPNVSFLSKPFQACALVTRVRELLARPAQATCAPEEHL